MGTVTASNKILLQFSEIDNSVSRCFNTIVQFVCNSNGHYNSSNNFVTTREALSEAFKFSTQIITRMRST